MAGDKVFSSAVLQEWFPTTTSPFIALAPMLGTATGKLAATVSAAGGFGM